MTTLLMLFVLGVTACLRFILYPDDHWVLGACCLGLGALAVVISSILLLHYYPLPYPLNVPR